MTDSPPRRPDDITSMASEKLPGADSAVAEADRVAALVETLARESAENKDKLLRALAEMENMRRRTERQVADARDYGITAFARDVLAVADNMSRALAALDNELREKAEPGVKALLDGVELTERELLKVLDKHGVKKFSPNGEKFDPNLHQAIYEVPDPSLPAGTVAQVVQAGYMIGERILRPALVGVAKGGPKVQPAAPAPPPDPPAEPTAKTQESAKATGEASAETPTEAGTETPANDNPGEPSSGKSDAPDTGESDWPGPEEPSKPQSE
jgi:molecular chaperone GrpE